MQLHVLIGADDFLIAETAKKVILPDYEVEVIDSINSTNADLQLADLRRAEESFAIAPMFSPGKVTWWKNVGFLPGGGKGGKVAEEVKLALEALSKRLATMSVEENQHFVLSGPTMLKTSVFAKNLAAKAEIIVFGGDKPWELSRNAEVRAIDIAAEMGLKFEPGVATNFIAIVGHDTRSIMSELGKLRDYLEPGVTTIKAADVQAISSPGVTDDPMPWELTDAIGMRNLSKALIELKRFELENGFEIFMSTMIEKLFRQLYDMKVASARGDIRKVTASMPPNTARKNLGFLPKWTERELRVARARFLNLREKVVSGTVAGPTLVVTELVRALRR